MKLIVGLGNPGENYKNTRHNIGFYIVDKIVESYNLSNWKSKFKGEYITVVINNEKTIFLKPYSYINLSGAVIRKYMDYFNIEIEDVLIICDDLDLNIGNFKLKEKGSSGGHNGLKNIELLLKSSNYKRLKVGISNNKNIETKDYVLGKFTKEDIEKINENLSIYKKVVLDFLTKDFKLIMSNYNKKNR